MELQRVELVLLLWYVFCVSKTFGTARVVIFFSSYILTSSKKQGVFQPDAVMRNIVAVIMAGVLGIYGLITAVVLSNQISGLQPNFGTLEGQTAVSPFGVYTAFDGFRHLAAGLTCGLSGLAAGMAIGIVGDSGVRAVGQQPALFVPSVLILIFSEALALYGLIIALILGIKSPAKVCQKE